MNRAAARAVSGNIMKWCMLLSLPILSMLPQAVADPAWKSELSAPALGSHPKLAPSVLDLQLSWNGAINSGTLRIEFAPADAKKPDAYVVRSSASSLGAAALLFPYKSNFWSELDPVTFRPRLFHSAEIDAKENTTTSATFFPDRVESSETTKNLKSGATKTSDKIFKFAPVFDIFSTMLYVRSQKLDTGDHINLVVCPFKTPYLLRVTVQGREIHNGRDAIRMTVGMRKINRDTLELQPYKKLKQDATLWLSDDADRIPIEFRAAAFIGDVRATLTSIKKS
ncbi:MAG: DUF3108 domain-containing protein [Luteolibacter sp.]